MSMKNFLYTAHHKIRRLDIQQCRTMCEHMAHNIEFLLSVFDSLKYGIIVVDLDGKVRMSNKIAKVICGHPIVLHNYIWNMLHEYSFARDIRYAIEHNEDFGFREYTLIKKSSGKVSKVIHDVPAIKIVRCALLPLVEQKSGQVFFDIDKYAENNNAASQTQSSRKNIITRNAVTGSIICLEDVSTEREIEQRTYRDKSFMSMKHITAGIAHEIKNPLSSISLHLELLRRKIQNSEKNVHRQKDMIRYIKVIEDEIQAMDKVVSVFLNDFKIQKSDFAPQDLHELLLEVLAFVAPNLEKHNIHIIKRFQNDLPKVYISSYAMTHVFLNIIKNAIDVLRDTHINGNGGKIQISTNYSDGKVRVVISDTGTGISEKLRKQIFDPYFTTKSKGSGIGLTIAYKLVRLHGGNIELDASYFKGASFIITLPAYANEQRLLSCE